MCDIAAQLAERMALSDISKGFSGPAPEWFRNLHAAALDRQESRDRRFPAGDGFRAPAFGPEYPRNVILRVPTVRVEFECVLEFELESVLLFGESRSVVVVLEVDCDEELVSVFVAS